MADMAKARGYPDRRGMGAQSDFISETFVPGEDFRKERASRAKALIASGFTPEQVATMLSMPFDQLIADISD
jgi:hypothetical protein